MGVRNYMPSGDATTPFNSLGSSGPNLQLQHFDLVLGHIQNENRILRFVAVVSVLAFFVSVGITLYAVSLPDSVPVLVTMNDFGETRYVGAVTRRNYQDYEVPEIALRQQVRRFVSLYYTLSTDRAVMKRFLDEAYHLLTSTTAAKYSTLLKEEDLFADFGTRTREVVFQTDPLRLSEDTYQVDFQVVTRTLSGLVSRNATCRAVVSVKTLQPAEDDVRDNPLGIYVTAFDFKEVNAAAGESAG